MADASQEPRRHNETYNQYWVRTHRERYNELIRNYRETHREEWNAYQREYNKKRRERDPNYVEKQRASSRKYYHQNNIKEKQAVRVKRLYHEDYDYRQKKKEYHKQKYYEDEEHRERVNAYAREYYARKKSLGQCTPKRQYK